MRVRVCETMVGSVALVGAAYASMRRTNDGLQRLERMRPGSPRLKSSVAIVCVHGQRMRERTLVQSVLCTVVHTYAREVATSCGPGTGTCTSTLLPGFVCALKVFLALLCLLVCGRGAGRFVGWRRFAQVGVGENSSLRNLLLALRGHA